MTGSVYAEAESPQCTGTELMVSKNSAGMTTKVPDEIKNRVSMYLRDKTHRENAKREMVVTILDYAGQSVFYATHQMCMSKAGFLCLMLPSHWKIKLLPCSVSKKEK